MLIIDLYKGEDTGTPGAREEGGEEEHLNKRADKKRKGFLVEMTNEVSFEELHTYIKRTSVLKRGNIICRGIKARNSIKSSGNSKLVNITEGKAGESII